MKKQITQDRKEAKEIERIIKQASREVNKLLKKGGFFISAQPFCKST